MAKENKDAAIRKRQLIAKANQTMFISVALASMIVGVAAVLTAFLVQEMMFNARVISAQDDSISTLRTNLENIVELEAKMEELQTNSALLSSRASTEDNALRVVIDALPSFENTAALGASISNILLNVPGITVESMTVETNASEATTTGESSSDVGLTDEMGGEFSDIENGGTPAVRAQAIEFSFSVSASGPDNILAVIRNLERSIRSIRITSFNLEQNNDGMSMSIGAQAFYLPQAEVLLREEVINSDGTVQAQTSISDMDSVTAGGQ